MKLLILDTETTGLPDQYEIKAKTRPMNWPHIVSISWIIIDSETNETIIQRSYVIKPIDWIISKESSAIHGIQHSFASRYGSPLHDVMNEFLAQEYDMMIAHNLDFDENVLINAIYWDLNRHDFQGFNKLKACTMKLTRSLCKLPSQYGYKNPKLSELYEHVFRVKPDHSRLHGSYYDTKILCDIIKTSADVRKLLGLNNKIEEIPNVSKSIKGNVLFI